MQLTKFTDYSLRTLMLLAIRPDHRATIDELAAAYRISRSHLTKVVHRLAQLGYITTTRGKTGGIALRKAPQDINIGELAARLETSMDLLECFRPEVDTCVISRACILKGVMHRALKAFIAVLQEYTLADIVANRAVLEQRLAQAASLDADTPRVR